MLDGLVPKIIGADVELANFLTGPKLTPDTSTGPAAALLLLREIDGVPANRNSCAEAYPMSLDAAVVEWGRVFLPANASSFYIDAHHIEINTFEALGPSDYVAAWRAMLRIANQARCDAEQRLKPGLTLEVIANTSDRRSNSFGSHLSVATTRAAWNSLFDHDVLRWLASLHACSPQISGAGKLGVENGAGPADFQLSERADFFRRLTTLDTTGPDRGIVNRRDEPLAGDERWRARYHCICYDSNLQTTAAFLKAGTLALAILMLEAGEVDLSCAFEDPVTAFQAISRDLTFASNFRTVDGSRATALDLQSRFLDRAFRFVESGRWEGLLPDAPRIVELWAQTLDMLRRRDLPALARRLDWALKLSILTHLLDRHPELNWTSPEVRYADIQYANIDPAKGLFWAYENAGLADKLVRDARIAHFVSNPPENTRAYARAMLLRRTGRDKIAEVDWDSITFRNPTGSPSESDFAFRLQMDDPSSFTRREIGDLLSTDATLEEVLDLLKRQQNGGNRVKPPVMAGNGRKKGVQHEISKT